MLTESHGPALNTRMFARHFCNNIFVLEVNVMAGVAAAGWKAHAAQQQVLQDCLANSLTTPTSPTPSKCDT